MAAINPDNMNILVADDEKATIISVSFVLRHCGHTVDAVTDGGEALLRVKEDSDRYQILITDHTMMNVSGLELVAELRALDYRGKIVVLSGHLTQELTEAYRALGADRLIPKPFDLADLRKAVEDLGAAMV
jgi:two-component system, chemotaxis family, chemotaxis protein CheY